MSVLAPIGFATPRLIRCRACNGDGRTPVTRLRCDVCDGVGGHECDDWPLATLSHNLAIAAGLCRAHEIGRLWGADEDARYVGWTPGCGKRAPVP